MMPFGFTLRVCDLQKKILGYSLWTSLCSHPKPLVIQHAMGTLGLWH